MTGRKSGAMSIGLTEYASVPRIIHQRYLE